MTARTFFFGLSLSLFLLPVSNSAWAGNADITSLPITEFKVGSDQKQFGQLEFVGGINLSSTNSLLGAMSSIRFYPDGQHFLTVLDTGHWASGKIERGPNGALANISDMTITAMIDSMGRDNAEKWGMDSEGLAFRDNQILVSFEEKHRVDIYPADSYSISKPIGTIPILIPIRQLRENGSLETMLVAPKDGPLVGAPLIIAEKSVNKDGNLLAAVLEGPKKGIFYVKRTMPYSATDGTFLPNGDILLLERRFGLSDGLGMRIRRIKSSDITPGATVDGEVILEAGAGYQIDNMEGIDAVIGPDGSTRLFLVSDDNHSFFQRTIMLEFKLLN